MAFSLFDILCRSKSPLVIINGGNSRFLPVCSHRLTEGNVWRLEETFSRVKTVVKMPNLVAVSIPSLKVLRPFKVFPSPRSETVLEETPYRGT